MVNYILSKKSNGLFLFFNQGKCSTSFYNLPKNIVDKNYNLISDHMWYRYGINFRKVGELKKGDQLTFTAQTRSYYKGQTHSKKEDYKLTEPRNIRLINREQPGPLPQTKKRILGYVLSKNNVNTKNFSEDYVNEYMEWIKSKR